MKMFGVNAVKKLKTFVFVLALAGTSLSFATIAQAQNITDAASCSQAVEATEAKILKTDMQPDMFNKIVADADAAKAACSAGDFAKANELVTSINDKLAKAGDQ